jgi:urea transport system permease protein
LFVFVVSAVIASLAGALYVPQVGIINPSEMAPDKSLEAVVWVAVGGRGTLIGPIVGAIVVNALKSWATRAFPDLWLIILGAMFAIVVLFMPKGLVGLPKQLYSLFQRGSAVFKGISAQRGNEAQLPVKETSSSPGDVVRTGRAD